MVTVKKDQSIELALDSKIQYKAIHKNKYQMPNIDTLIESISQQTSAPAPRETTYFSRLDLKKAYSQLNLDPNTAIRSNFKIITGDISGTYRFQTGFYGLTDMPAEFQKTMDYNIIGFKKTFKGSEAEHKQNVLKCLKRLDDKNLRINLPKFHFLKARPPLFCLSKPQRH